MVIIKHKSLYPWADEKTYAKKLNYVLVDLQQRIFNFLDLIPAPKAVHADDDDISAFSRQLNSFIDSLQPSYTGAVAHDAAKNMLNGVNRMSQVYVQRVIVEHDGKQPLTRDALGDLSDDEKKFLNGKLVENTSLIKSVGDEYLNKVQDTVYRGVSQGLSTKEMRQEIQATTGVSQRRANLIARDQTGKAYGALNRFKQMDAGINNFTWSTAEDERVRPAHREIDGKIFSWADGWAGVYPGDPIQCRCTANAVFDDEAAAAPDDDFWNPDAPDAVMPSKANGNPNPPKVEPKAAEKPDEPYWANLENKPEWLKASGAKMNLPVEQEKTQIATGKTLNLPSNHPEESTNNSQISGSSSGESGIIEPDNSLDMVDELIAKFIGADVKGAMTIEQADTHNVNPNYFGGNYDIVERLQKAKADYLADNSSENYKRWDKAYKVYKKTLEKYKLYGNNCQRCAPAYELRRRGIDVEAMPLPKLKRRFKRDMYTRPGETMQDAVERLIREKKVDRFEINTNEVWLDRDGHVPQTSSLNIKRMSQFSNALEAVVKNNERYTIEWGRTSGSGHIVNMERIGGKIMFIDNQSGKIYGIDEFIASEPNIKASTISYLRVDDKFVNHAYVKEILKRKE